MQRSLTSLRYEIARREAITPFICSTFKDFAEERDHLANIIFPKLQGFCQERGTRFSPVDLRWNEESCSSNGSLVLQQCLDDIEQCSPYFICLLGERYGVHRPPDSVTLSDEGMAGTVEWLEKNFETAAACGNEWLLEDENKHCSITELEIIKASFRERTDHGYFYFRDPEQVQKQSIGQDVSQKALLMEIYDSENDFAATKIKELKQQIIDTDLPVKHFKSVEELGNLVLKDWLSVLNSIHPPIEKKIFYTTSGVDFREWSCHESFARTRRKVFVTTRAIRMMYDILTRHARYLAGGLASRSSSGSLTKINEGTFLTSVLGMETFPSIVALVGERGCGVTAILANWVKRFIQENPRAVVISHYTESGQRAAEITSFMRRCTRELRSEFRGSNTPTGMNLQDLTDFESIREAFHASLSFGPCVLVLDGLSHLSSCQSIPAHVIKQLAWLPKNLPPSCRIVVSTTRSDISCKHLTARSDVHVIDVPPLQSNDDKSRVLLEWLGKHARYLDSRDQAAILAGKLSGVPLFHVALANEIRLYGTASISEKQLEVYTRARDFSDFWSAVIHRWSHDYSWLKPTLVKNGLPMKTQVSKDRLNNGWLPDALRLISVSREGLSSDELTRILCAFGYSRKHAISPAAWRLFTSAARHALYVRADGLLSFQQASVREAVDCLLLNGLTSPSNVRHVTAFDNPWEVQKFQYHSVLTNSFAIFQCDERLVAELPWQHKAAGDVEGLKKTLSKPKVFVTMLSNRLDLRAVSDFVHYWKFLTKNGHDSTGTYSDMITAAENTLTIGDSEDNLELEDVSVEENLGIADRILKKKPDAKFTAIEVSYLAYLVGTYFMSLQKLVSAELMMLNAFKLARNVTSIDDVDFLCEVQRSLGDLYYEGKFLEKAALFYESVLKTAPDVTRYVNTDKVGFLALQAHVHNRLAAISVRQMLTSLELYSIPILVDQPNGNPDDNGSKSKDALVLVPKVGDIVNEALRLTQLAKLEEGKASLYHTMALLAFCEKRYDEADILLNKAVDEMERWYGPSHPAVAVVLHDLARYHSHSECEADDVIRIEKIYRRVLKIRETKLGRSHLDVSETLVDLGCLLKVKGTRDSSEECRHMLQRAVDIRTEKLGIQHESTKAIRSILMKLQ